MSSSTATAATAASTFQSHFHLHQHQSHATSRTRFYAHRIRESLTSRVIMFLCSILLTLLFISGIIVLILWLSFRPHRPRFYLFSFSASSPNDLSFVLSCSNPNSKIAISYGDITASVFYNNRQLAIGAVHPAFYQPPKNTTEIQGQLTGNAGIIGVETGERAELRLELSSSIQFRLSTWDTRLHEMHASCECGLGPDGKLLPEFQGERCSIYFG